MTIAHIVLRSGMGPQSSIALFVTHGLATGAAPPPVVGDTHDGFKKKHEVDHKKLNKILTEREKQKLEAQQKLRRQLDKAAYGEEPEIEENEIIVQPNAPVLENRIEQITQEIVQLQQQIQFYEEALRLEAIQARRDKDEHEIELILNLLNQRNHELLTKFTIH